MHSRLVLVACLVLLGACERSRQFDLVYPTASGGSEATRDGRPVGCPEGQTDPHGDGTPSAMRTKCSYDDAIGAGATKLRGKVYAEAPEEGLGRGVPELLVSLHEVEDPAHRLGAGEQIAETTTDAQGGFNFSAILPPAQYDLVVRVPEDGRPLASQRLRLEGTGSRKLEGLRITLPLDPRLQ